MLEIFWFQSLFYWMYVKNCSQGRLQDQNIFYVSILVLLDVCKERGTSTSTAWKTLSFQSLFYWMYVKNSLAGEIIYL